MVRIVTDYLDQTAKLYPDKAAFIDERRTMTFSGLQEESRRIAGRIIELGLRKNPVAVYLNKSVECIAAFMGTAYSGNFYSPIDTKMPAERIRRIIDRLKPSAIITDESHMAEAEEFSQGAGVILYEEAQRVPADIGAVERAKSSVIDSDVLYVLFTSGSTGTPKGVTIPHRGVIDLAEWLAYKLGHCSESVIANQAPFYFSMSVVDIYSTLKNGATMFIVPEQLFTQPARLMQYVHDRKINTVNWIPSLMQMLSMLKALNRPHIDSLHTVSFGGEVLQTKHLNRWREEYPNVKFWDLYGPTEVTDTCTYYEIKRPFADDELLPVGYSCENKDCFLLSDNDKLITQPGILGEICVRGSGLAYGYYNDPQNTAKAFVQNPLNTSYPETIYRTGDLARYNEHGELVYVCRKDFQIKHMGRRIELGEIEAAVSSVDGVEDCCCLYDSDRMIITLYYVGKTEREILGESLKKLLPDYMIPGKYIRLPEMPHNLNGKIDRQKLKAMMKEGK